MITVTLVSGVEVYEEEGVSIYLETHGVKVINHTQHRTVVFPWHRVERVTYDA